MSGRPPAVAEPCRKGRKRFIVISGDLWGVAARRCCREQSARGQPPRAKLFRLAGSWHRASSARGVAQPHPRDALVDRVGHVSISVGNGEAHDPGEGDLPRSSPRWGMKVSAGGREVTPPCAARVAPQNLPRRMVRVCVQFGFLHHPLTCGASPPRKRPPAHHCEGVFL